MAGLMGAGPWQSLTAALPPDRFHCLLDELPLHLIPTSGRKLLRAKAAEGQPFFLNPECELLDGSRLPGELAQASELTRDFFLQGSVAWVRDAATASLRPFWLGAGFQELIMKLRRGEVTSGSLPAPARALLLAADILVTAEHRERKRAEWDAQITKSRPAFRDKGYVPVSGLLHPFHVAALRRYYRQRIRRGAIRLGDHQSARRYVAYNDGVARFFHHQLAPAVAAVVGEPIMPSYVYLASYLSGAELRKHTDREQCEFSVTLCLDFSPEPEIATPWPICLDTPAGKVAVHQALGDGLFYRGTQLPHYRGALPEGHTSTSIFFHYVPADFAAPLA